MEMHQLTYFVAVAETGGFSSAARRCNVTQPSLSQQIMKLENEVGQKLFDRLGRTVVMTEAGRLLLPRARAVLAEVQDIERCLSQDIEDGHGMLRVGFIPTIAPFLLPTVIKRFTASYPRAELSVYENLTDKLIKELIAGKLDVGIMSLPINHRLIETEEICTEQLLVASSRQHNLISKGSFKTKELESFPFIALNEIHCLGEQVQAFCYQKDVNLEIVCHTSQLSTVYGCVAQGLGVSLVPQVLAAMDEGGQLQYRVMSDGVPERKIVAAFHSGRLRPFLAERFVELVQEEYQGLIERPIS